MLCRYTSVPYEIGDSPCPQDGMVLNPWSMPGGPYVGFDLGMSAVHEFGCAQVDDPYRSHPHACCARVILPGSGLKCWRC